MYNVSYVLQHQTNAIYLSQNVKLELKLVNVLRIEWNIYCNMD